MSTSRVEGAGIFQFDSCFYHDQINKVIDFILPQYDRIIRKYVLLNILFLSFGFTQIILLIGFFSFLVQSSLVAISLAILFLTLFSYFMLRIYLQTKKPEEFDEIQEKYFRACHNFLNYQADIPEHNVALANACCKFAKKLEGREYHIYPIPKWLDFLAPSLERFSCWWHWLDLHYMKEILLLSAVEEHIKLVKSEPTNLEVHVALANSYVMLSHLYMDPRKGESDEEERWAPSEELQKELQRKFRLTVERVIEEFKILSDYAPDDPWVHAQLAYSYHDLQMPQEEIREYETIIKLRPGDKEAFFKLGFLYFQQGQNAQGLSIYEELKRTNYKKAESLIDHYGDFRPLNQAIKPFFH